MLDKANYYAVIPTELILDTKITANAKLLFGLIASLTNTNNKCFATDSYFAKIFNVSKTSIQNWLNDLESNNYIKRVINYKEDSKEIESRHIQIIFNRCIQENLYTYTRNLERDNNIIYNNNNISKDILAEAKKTKKDLDNLSLEELESNFINSKDMKVLFRFLDLAINTLEIKEALKCWLTNCYNNKKYLSLRQLENQLDLLRDKSKDEILDIIRRTDEYSSPSFRITIEMLDKNKKNFSKEDREVRITEQKITKELGKEKF